ncbi:jg22921, partial [Pararge aegeria aegeria]
LRPVMLRRRKYPPPMVGGFKVDYYTFPYQEYINLVVNGAGVIDLR